MKLSDLLPGAAESLATNVNDQLQKRQQQQADLNKLTTAAYVEQLMKNRFDPDYRVKNQLLDELNMPAEESPTLALSPNIDPAAAMILRQKFQHATDRVQMEQAQRTNRINALMQLAGKGGGITYNFNPETKQAEPVVDQSGKPISSRNKLITQPLTTEAKASQAEQVSAARTRGALGERGLSGETAGRLALSDQGSRMAEVAKSTLFPDGTPQSFRRDIAAKLSDPTGASMIGDQEAQDAEFALWRALAAQTLVQTGVAARPDERKQLVREFISNMLADPENAYFRVDELGQVLSSARSSLDPKGRFSGGSVQATSTSAASLNVGGTFNGQRIKAVKKLK